MHMNTVKESQTCSFVKVIVTSGKLHPNICSTFRKKYLLFIAIFFANLKVALRNKWCFWKEHEICCTSLVQEKYLLFLLQTVQNLLDDRFVWFFFHQLSISKSAMWTLLIFNTWTWSQNIVSLFERLIACQLTPLLFSKRH